MDDTNEKICELVERVLLEGTGNRTNPVYLDHVELSGYKDMTTHDIYGRYMNVRKAIIDVYITIVNRFNALETRKVAYMWTRDDIGQKTADKINERFSSKWITAEIAYDRGRLERWSTRGMEIVDPQPEAPKPRQEPEPTPPPPSPKQMTLGI